LGKIVLQVQSRVIESGKQTPAFDDVRIEIDGAEISVEDLIRAAVEQQIRLLQASGAKTTGDAARALRRQYLGQRARDAESPAATKGRKPAPPVSTNEPLDADRAVRQALDGFEEGAFVIVAGGKQARSRLEVLRFPFDDRVTFLRLTPLIGG